jgi:hypothetical protein
MLAFRRRCGHTKSLHAESGRPCAIPGPTAASVAEDVGYDRAAMADQTQSQPLDQQLQEIGAQLAWVRDYL